MKKICKNCQSWHSPENSEFGNCLRLKNGAEIRISNRLLQTTGSFGCNKFKKRELKNGTDTDGSEN